MARSSWSTAGRTVLLFSVIAVALWLARPMYWALDDGARGLLKRQICNGDTDLKESSSFHGIIDPELSEIFSNTQQTKKNTVRGVLDPELDENLSTNRLSIEEMTSSVIRRLDALKSEVGYTKSLSQLVLDAVKVYEKEKSSTKAEGGEGGGDEKISTEKVIEEDVTQISEDSNNNNNNAEKIEVPEEEKNVPKREENNEVDEKLAKGVRNIIHEGKPLIEDLKRDIWDAPPPETPMPPREEFALRREMAEFRAENKIITITFSNFAFMDFVINWVRHLTNVGVKNILVGAMDASCLEGLFREGVPVFDLESNMPTGDPGWGSPIFHKMGREKVTLINVFLSLGYEIFICDTDTVFTKNPLPYFARYPTVDVFSSSDELVGGAKGDGLEPYDRAWASLNIGILHFRPTKPAKKFAREWAEKLAKDDSIWDQTGFNDIMRRKLGPSVPGGDNIVFAHNGDLKLAILPVSIFCSGHTYFVQRKAEKLNLEVYAIHTTFQFAGTSGKRHRFRESQLFYDNADYYNPPGGLLAFKLEIPDHLLHKGKHSLETHFNLVNYQLVAVRKALALATILDRTLVMPPLYCRFDRVWFPHPGILHGTDTSQPFLCPLDHVIEVNRMLEEMSSDEFGPSIRFREYSFLDNPRTPLKLKRSKVIVDLCDPSKENCPFLVEKKGIVSLPKNASQNQVETILRKKKSAKLLYFSNILDAFGSWDDKMMEEKFRWRISHYLGIWCCVDKNPGHVWYDFFWDEKPDWKPVPPKNWKEDHPAFAKRPSFL